MPFTAGDLERGSVADDGDALAAAALALALRFSSGATLWCVAPVWREHARHVAVEFVHPVVVGKPALAAVSVDDADVVNSLRALVTAGDVVLVVGDACDHIILDVVRRCPAWGALAIWIGVGPRPAPGAADHVLWVDNNDTSVDSATVAAVHDGRLVFQYHVLWELTHVCLEHPGLMSVDADSCDDVACVTCSDEGRVGEVNGVDKSTATVRTARGTELVDTMLVGHVSSGDLLLIHAGTAIAVLGAEGTDRAVPANVRTAVR